MAIVKSFRGDVVDFDLLKIKQQIGSTPAPITVSERNEFIDNKLQRRIRRVKDNIEEAKTIETVKEEVEQPNDDTKIVSDKPKRQPRKVKK